MKYIKQKSTNKIVYREHPFDDKAMSNAVIETGIDESDLEIVEEDLSTDEWNKKSFDQESWTFKRKAEYPTMEECIHAILDDELDALQAKRKLVKDKYPKE